MVTKGLENILIYGVNRKRDGQINQCSAKITEVKGLVKVRDLLTRSCLLSNGYGITDHETTLPTKIRKQRVM